MPRFRNRCTVGLAALLVVGSMATAPPGYAISFDEAEKLDKIEATELLSRARDAASSGNTSSARSFIAQARAKGATAAQIRAAENAVAQAEERAAQARRAEEARRQAEQEAANRPSGGGGGGGAGSAGSGAVTWRVDRQIAKANRPWWSGGAVTVSCTGGPNRGKTFDIDYITASRKWDYNDAGRIARSTWQEVANDVCSGPG